MSVGGLFFLKGFHRCAKAYATKSSKCVTQRLPPKAKVSACLFTRFFANKDDDPVLLMEAATWWIETHGLDHFVKAVTIRQMVRGGN